MAQSRNFLVGNIFTRVAGLLRAGGLKLEERPVWFDVYAAFPPLDEPKGHHPEDHIHPPPKLPQLFYPEDAVRSRYLREFDPPATSLFAKHHQPIMMQKFVDKFYEMAQSRRESDTEAIFRATVDALQSDGFRLVPRAIRASRARRRSGLRRLKSGKNPYSDAESNTSTPSS